MAWINIPDATFDPDRPVLGSTHLAIKNNFAALADGAAGAPKIQTPAYQDASVTTSKIADFNVTNSKLGTDAVDSRALGPSAVQRVNMMVATRSFAGSIDRDAELYYPLSDNMAFLPQFSSSSSQIRGSVVNLSTGTQFFITNTSGSGGSFSVSWRYIP